jgi:hypothetical protein
LNGETKEANTTFKKSYETSHTGWLALMLLMAAVDLDDSTMREEFDKTLVSKHREQAPKSVQIWELFHQALDRNKEGTVDLKAVDQVLESIPVERRGNTELIVGKYLKNHGKPEDARRYLEISLKSAAVPDWSRALAGEALRTLPKARPETPR